MADKRYCEDCRFCMSEPGRVEFAKCGHPDAKRPDREADRFVSRSLDKPEHFASYCSTVRLSERNCGPSAAWFEPKPADQVAA